MKHLIFASAVIAAGLCNQAAHAAPPAECFTNSGAVFAAHPNATHASYMVRGKRSGGPGRCWFADAFKTEAKANPKSASRPVAAAVVKTSTPRSAITAPAPHPHTTAAVPVSQPRTMAFAPAPQPRTTGVAPASLPATTAFAPASPPVIVQFPNGIPPAIQIAVNAQELSRLLQVDETPADFESRFSVSGYKVRK
jgi:hypothetical protein